MHSHAGKIKTCKMKMNLKLEIKIRQHEIIIMYYSVMGQVATVDSVSFRIFFERGNSNVSRNLEGQWIDFLISCGYFKGGKCPPKMKPWLSIKRVGQLFGLDLLFKCLLS